MAQPKPPFGSDKYSAWVLLYFRCHFVSVALIAFAMVSAHRGWPLQWFFYLILPLLPLIYLLPLFLIAGAAIALYSPRGGARYLLIGCADLAVTYLHCLAMYPAIQ